MPVRALIDQHRRHLIALFERILAESPRGGTLGSPYSERRGFFRFPSHKGFAVQNEQQARNVLLAYQQVRVTLISLLLMVAAG